MADLTPDVCRQIAEARKAKGLTQSALAQAVGCKQSAISMLESGQPSKLSAENIGKIADVLGIALVLPTAQIVAAVPTATALKGNCPNAHCPSSVPYWLQGRVVFQPKLQEMAQGRFCAHCGEILETACPNCGRAVHVPGAFCTQCGEVRVTNTLAESDNTEAWATAQRHMLAELRTLTQA
jgi:transcriptional regulator with XRE-family HTH domain